MILTFEKLENNTVFYSVKETKNLPIEIYLIDKNTNTIITKNKYEFLDENCVYYVSPHDSLHQYLDVIILRSVHYDGEINLEIEFNKTKVKPILINEKKFESFFNNRESFYTLKEIFYDKCYDSEIVKPEPNDEVVVDIGANLGFFSLYAHSVGVKKIYCFEPDPKNFITLLENTKNLENVFCNNFAISDRVDILPFCFSEIYSSGSHLKKFKDLTNEHYTHQTNVITINIEKIFEFFRLDFIDYLKLDCEGAEIDIFENIDSLYLNRIKKISLEFHSIEIMNTIKKILLSNNFIIEKENFLHNSDSVGMIFAYNKDLFQ